MEIARNEDIKNEKVDEDDIMEIIAISVGGSVINPGTIDVEFLERFTRLITDHVTNHQRKFVLVTGGGSVARQYINALPPNLTEGEKDAVGIMATWLNAKLLSLYLKHLVAPILPRTLEDIVEQFSQHPVVILGGLLPAVKTDEDAAIVGDYLGASRLINVTNVDGVYDSDPRKNPRAKKYEHLSYQQFRQVVQDLSTKAGANAPFTLIAMEIARRSHMKIYVVPKDIEAIDKAIKGESVGTVIG